MIRFDDVHAIKLIANAASIQFVPMLHHCIASYSDSDMLMGGVLFTEYLGGSVQIHMAGFRRNWVNKALLWLAFDYPFNQLNVNKLVALVPEWNVHSRNNTIHLGFQIEYLSPHIFNRTDGVNGMYLMSMLRKDCKWLHMKRPYIELAPPERTNSINQPLAHMDTIGMMQ